MTNSATRSQTDKAYTLDMADRITTPQTTIGIAWADPIALVPRRAQGRAIEIALILLAEYAMGELSAERNGYARGVT
jgi:hypothetical protein